MEYAEPPIASFINEVTRMIPVKHTDIRDLCLSATGDFSFITLHTRKGTPVRWTYSIKLKDYAGAGYFYQPPV